MNTLKMNPKMKAAYDKLGDKPKRIVDILETGKPVRTSHIAKVLGENADNIAAHICLLREKGFIHSAKLNGSREFTHVLNESLKPQGALRSFAPRNRTKPSRKKSGNGDILEEAIQEIMEMRTRLGDLLASLRQIQKIEKRQEKIRSLVG